MSCRNYRDLCMVGNIHVYLDVSIDDVKCGRVVVELFKNLVPRTAENFRALCTGEKGLGDRQLPLHYKDSIFHKAVPECIVQGGDIINHDGTGGESIYGPYFADEKPGLLLEHSEEGLLSMANCGTPDTNNSQFCVTLGQASHLDGSYVVFGRVVKGFNIINNISYQQLGPGERPVSVCKIWNCGELKPGQDWGYCDSDLYPPYPQDWDRDPSTVQANDILEVVKKIKDAGNQILMAGDSVYAHQKYIKALRYIDWYSSRQSRDEDVLAQVRAHCRLNAALACIRIHHYREAVHHCNEVPDIEENMKALFRRGMAKERLNDHQEALADLHAALRLAPADQRAPIIGIEHGIENRRHDAEQY
uniref:peptidylprolyl isomerase n=1 Tax=Graphocephala atropunctata TaxID=36148 RepID=A0A1B6MAJ6_9HEMI